MLDEDDDEETKLSSWFSGETDTWWKGDNGPVGPSSFAGVGVSQVQREERRSAGIVDHCRNWGLGLKRSERPDNANLHRHLRGQSVQLYVESMYGHETSTTIRRLTGCSKDDSRDNWASTRCDEAHKYISVSAPITIRSNPHQHRQTSVADRPQTPDGSSNPNRDNACCGSWTPPRRQTSWHGPTRGD